MKLYTKFGDEGETALFDGTRVWKNDARVDAYGTIDELCATLGWCRATADETMAGRLEWIQRDLFVMGAHLATPAGGSVPASVGSIGPEHGRRLEQWIDEATQKVEPLRHFILPGGCEPASRLHIARTCCRRAERAVVSVHRSEPLAPGIVIYLNRLSDLLFAWSRQCNHEANCPETQWIPGQ